TAPSLFAPVTWCRRDPSAFMTQSPPPSANAILVPSGDQLGVVPEPRSRSLEPSGFTTCMSGPAPEYAILPFAPGKAAWAGTTRASAQSNPAAKPTPTLDRMFPLPLDYELQTNTATCR